MRERVQDLFKAVAAGASLRAALCAEVDVNVGQVRGSDATCPTASHDISCILIFG